MKKQQLKDKLIGFQKKIISLTQELNEKERLFEEKQQHNYLELISIVDSFENIFNTLDSKEKTPGDKNPDKTSNRVIKSCRAVYRKTMRILEDKQVKKIEFFDNKAQPGLCRIIETQIDLNKEEGSIVQIVKNGYKKDSRIIRTAEVITIANHKIK